MHDKFIKTYHLHLTIMIKHSLKMQNIKIFRRQLTTFHMKDWHYN
jgi:hypothetical protein